MQGPYGTKTHPSKDYPVIANLSYDELGIGVFQFLFHRITETRDIQSGFISAELPFPQSAVVIQLHSITWTSSILPSPASFHDHSIVSHRSTSLLSPSSVWSICNMTKKVKLNHGSCLFVCISHRNLTRPFWQSAICCWNPYSVMCELL